MDNQLVDEILNFRKKHKTKYFNDKGSPKLNKLLESQINVIKMQKETQEYRRVIDWSKVATSRRNLNLIHGNHCKELRICTT